MVYTYALNRCVRNVFVRNYFYLTIILETNGSTNFTDAETSDALKTRQKGSYGVRDTDETDGAKHSKVAVNQTLMETCT